MNEQITQVLAGMRDPRRLAVSSHEIGHAVGAIAAGVQPEYVRLKFDIIGGFIGGVCHLGDDNTEMTREVRTADLISWMAGHAAEVRFCQLYLGMDTVAAYNYGREWAAGDYDNFGYWRAKYRIHISHDWAFQRATRLLELNTTALDWLTLRLHRHRELATTTLPATVAGGLAGAQAAGPQSPRRGV